MTRGTLVPVAGSPIAALFAVLVIRPAAQSAPRRIVRGIVPVEATIEPLAQPTRGGNAVLRVRYAEGVRLPVRVPYATEYGTVVLADDGQGFDARAGDGLYTALGTMDLAATRARLVELSRSDTAMPTRTWRDRSKTSLDVRIDPSRFRVGERFPFEPWGNPAAISASRVAADPAPRRRRGRQPHQRRLRPAVNGRLELRLSDGADGQHTGDRRHRSRNLSAPGSIDG